MARTSYQYETSPRKFEPEYRPKKTTTTKSQRAKIEKKKREEEQQRIKMALKQEKRKHHKNIAIIMGVFLVFLVISYRNSLITERFNEIQNKKDELSAIEKTSGQLKVNIESSLNLNNIEDAAKERLGMQKLNNNQKVYISLNKKDYTESSKEEITDVEDSNYFMKFINNLFN